MSQDDMLDLLEGLLRDDARDGALEELERRSRDGCADARVVTYLIPVLHVPDVGPRRRASWLVAKMAQNKTSTFWPLEELNGLLHDDDAEVRENAAWAIGELTSMRIGGLGSIERLNRLLGDAMPSVRGMAAWALGRLAERMGMGFQSSMAPLRRLLDDRYDGVRRNAQYALEHLKAAGVEE